MPAEALNIPEAIEKAFEGVHFETIVPHPDVQVERLTSEVGGQLFRLVTENIPLLLGLVGLVVCVAVVYFFMKLFGGGGLAPLIPLPGNTEQIYHVPGSQGTLF